MLTTLATCVALAEALGIGLLIGIEREQQAHRSGKEASAGVRTFTLASLVGALSMLAGGVPLLAVAVVIVGVVRVAWIVVRGDQTVGLTTSLALITVVLLGALAIETATMAAGVAVLIASLLAGLGGILLASRIGSSQVNAGSGYLMDAVAAAWIGFSLAGSGKPNALGTLVGAVILGVLSNGLVMLSVPYYAMDIIKGLVLAVALAITYIQKR